VADLSNTTCKAGALVLVLKSFLNTRLTLLLSCFTVTVPVTGASAF
jgi:hypothetical protein